MDKIYKIRNKIILYIFNKSIIYLYYKLFLIKKNNKL